MTKQTTIDRPPRIQPELPVGEYQIPAPPELEENTNQPLIQVALPLVTIIGYIFVALLGRGSNMMMIIPMGLAVIGSTFIALYSFLREKKLRDETQAAYTQRLTELRREMENQQEMQCSFYHYNYPEPEKTIRMAMDLGCDPGNRLEDIRSGSRLWERRFYDPDFGRIRLGLGVLPSTVTYRLNEENNYSNPLLREAVRLAEDSRYVRDVPITIPLKQYSEKEAVRFTMGITGSNEGHLYEFLRTLLIDYATFHSPNDTRIFVAGSDESRQQWRWAYNLPHCRENDRSETLFFETAHDNPDPRESERMRLALKTLRNQLERRKIRLEDKDQSHNVTHPFLLLIVDVLHAVPAQSILSDLEAESAISTILQDGDRLGAAVIFLVPNRSKVPSSCQAVLEVDPDPNDAEKIVYRYAEVGINSQRYVGGGSVIRGQDRAREFARQIESLSVRSSYGVDLATTVTLMEILNTGSMDQLQQLARSRWQHSTKPENADWLNVGVGLLAGNEVRRMVFSAKADGVHGLVAGSTGSGKSELLTSLILGLAINYDPSIINFVLVDYKGGSAFEPFRRLPHVVDIVTNLEGSATSRMFAAINAELDRRQRINTQNDAKDIVHYRTKALHLREFAPPYPHLFIIIDEFAEMIAGNAEFKSQLESITRLGRSLGVTLILAAQRPSGVTDQMRANIKFRICLRVETPEDSRELLRRSDAAYLPPGIPGRGYLQVGNENIELIQTAYTGGDYRGSQETAKPNVIWVDRKKKKDKQGGDEVPKLHSAIVDMLANLATEESKPQWRPWPAFLPRRFSLETPIDMGYMSEQDTAVIQSMADVGDGTFGTEDLSLQLPINGRVNNCLAGDVHWLGLDWAKNAMQPVVGLIDNPYAARQHPLMLNFPSGHVALFGASGWGKTTFIRTLLTSLAVTHSPDELHVYILDFGGRGLSMFRDLPHVGAVINSDEEERVQRLLRHITNLLEERQVRLSTAGVNDLYTFNQSHPESILPAVLVVVDNFAEFKENYESLMSSIISLVREARAYGIHFLFTADQPNSLSGKLFNLITERMTLKLTDAAEYATVVGRGVPDMGNIPGRGYTRVGRTPLEFQTALPLGGQEEETIKRVDEGDSLKTLILNLKRAWNNDWKSAPPASIDTLAVRVSLDALLQTTGRPDGIKRLMPVLGLDDRDLKPFRLDLEKLGPHFLVVGPPNSGKTTVMRSLLLSITHTYGPDEILVVLADFQRRFASYGGEKNLEQLPQVIQLVSKAEDMKPLVENLKVECAQLAAKRRRIFLLADNYDSLTDELGRGSLLTDLGVLAREYGTAGFHVVIAGSPALMSAADDLRKQVSSSSFGIALQTADAVGRINGKMPRSLAEAELPMGRAFVVKSGRTFMVQVATPYLTDDAVEESLDEWVTRIGEKWPLENGKVEWSRKAMADDSAEREVAELERIKTHLREVGVSDDLMDPMSPEDLRNMAQAYGLQVG